MAAACFRRAGRACGCRHWYVLTKRQCMPLGFRQDMHYFFSLMSLYKLQGYLVLPALERDEGHVYAVLQG